MACEFFFLVDMSTFFQSRRLRDVLVASSRTSLYSDGFLFRTVCAMFRFIVAHFIPLFLRAHLQYVLVKRFRYDETTSWGNFQQACLLYHG